MNADALTVQELISTKPKVTSTNNQTADSYTLSDIFNQLSLSGELSKETPKVTTESINVPTESGKVTPAVTEVTNLAANTTIIHSGSTTEDPNSSEDYEVRLLTIT